MERRTVDGVDKQHDAQRARSRASGAESNPTNTTARASGGSWRARGWRSEGVVWREGRVGPGCEFVVFFDETRANFGTIDLGAPPQARMPLPQLGSHPLQEVRKSNGRPLHPPLKRQKALSLFGARPRATMAAKGRERVVGVRDLCPRNFQEI